MPLYSLYVLCVLLLAYTLNFVDRVVIGILAVPIKSELALSNTQLGLLGGSAFVVFYTTLGIPIGRVADRVNRVGILTVALGLWSAFTALCGLAGTFTVLFLSRLGVGVGEAGGVAPAYALLSDYFAPRTRARALAVFSLGIPVGSALGFLLGAHIAALHGWRMAFIVLGISGLVLAPLLAVSVRDPRRGRTPAGIAPPPPLRLVVALLAAKPSFWFLALGAAFSSLIGYGLLFWLPSFFHTSYGMALIDIGRLLATITFLGGVLGMFLGGVVADRLGPRDPRWYAWVPAAASLVIVPCYALALRLPPGGLTWILYTVPAALQLVWFGPVLSAIQQLVPATMRALASSVFLFVLNVIGLGLGSFVLGYVSDRLHARYGVDALRYAILWGTGCYVIAAAFLLLAAPRIGPDTERT